MRTFTEEEARKIWAIGLTGNQIRFADVVKQIDADKMKLDVAIARHLYGFICVEMNYNKVKDKKTTQKASIEGAFLRIVKDKTKLAMSEIANFLGYSINQSNIRYYAFPEKMRFGPPEYAQAYEKIKKEYTNFIVRKQ